MTLTATNTNPTFIILWKPEGDGVRIDILVHSQWMDGWHLSRRDWNWWQDMLTIDEQLGNVEWRRAD